jgi:hypothetical protein
LNPVPGDVAVAVSNRVAVAHGGRSMLCLRVVKDGRPWLTIG